MLRRPALLFLPALLLVACAATPPRLAPGGGGWVLLGERAVDHRTERDEIAVGAASGTFERIRLVVRQRPVAFHEVRVHFMDGTVQDVALASTIAAGGESRAVDLAGSDRRIARVTFVYDTAGRRARGPRATVALYGWR